MSPRFFLRLAAVVAMAACESPVATLDVPAESRLERSLNAPVHTVTVGGQLDLSAFEVANETYGIVAQKDGNGNVTGNATVVGLHVDDTQIVNLHGDVTCLQVNGSQAWVGVTITKSSLPNGPFGVGGSFWFRVQDNGEGANASADRISNLNPNGGAARCNEMRTGLPLAWEMIGNVQVR